MKSFPVFPEYGSVRAFFTEKPERTALLIPSIASKLPEGEYFIKPWMVHGKRVQVVDRDFLAAEHVSVQGYPELKGARGYIEVPDTDGLVTDVPGVALVTTHGDCIPVWTYDPVRNVIGVAHAGWKGTMLGIAGELVSVMKEHYSCRPEDILAYIGPGIDKCCFEVMEDVCAQFRAQDPRMEDFIRVRDSEHWLIDLKGINGMYLKDQGVEKTFVSPECTCCLADKYWSYRGRKESDRMLAYIKLKK